MLKVLPTIITILFLIPIHLFQGCTPAQNNDYRRLTFQHPSMGSMFKVVLYSRDSAHAAMIVDMAFSRLDSLNLMMSDYIPHSELMRLSRTSGNGEFVPVSRPLMDIMEKSRYWFTWSEGIFDVTVGPYTQLWRRAKRQGELPDEDRINEARSSVGFDQVTIDQIKGIRLDAKGMQLDLGGIAKGYAVDAIFDMLVMNGYESCLVDGGGDLRAGKAPSDADGWRIEIQSHIGEDAFQVIENKAIATSGDFYRNLEIEGKRYSHIIDPRTGYGMTLSRAVTVEAMDCKTADVLASVFSVAGPHVKDLNKKVPDGVLVTFFEKEGEDVRVYQLSRGKVKLLN